MQIQYYITLCVHILVIQQEKKKQNKHCSEEWRRISAWITCIDELSCSGLRNEVTSCRWNKQISQKFVFALIMGNFLWFPVSNQSLMQLFIYFYVGTHLVITTGYLKDKLRHSITRGWRQNVLYLMKFPIRVFVLLYYLSAHLYT
jgi:hypothetical protein